VEESTIHVRKKRREEEKGEAGFERICFGVSDRMLKCTWIYTNKLAANLISSLYT
jgi:hypothetical protein